MRPHRRTHAGGLMGCLVAGGDAVNAAAPIDLAHPKHLGQNRIVPILIWRWTIDGPFQTLYEWQDGSRGLPGVRVERN